MTKKLSSKSLTKWLNSVEGSTKKMYGLLLVFMICLFPGTNTSQSKVAAFYYDPTIRILEDKVEALQNDDLVRQHNLLIELKTKKKD